MMQYKILKRSCLYTDMYHDVVNGKMISQVSGSWLVFMWWEKNHMFGIIQPWQAKCPKAYQTAVTLYFHNYPHLNHLH